ncbi:MAG: hypothetical protein ABIU63_09455 [Chitinophagaceae bacterium]
MKTLVLLVLLTSISAELCAQTKADKAFEVPDNIVFNRRFYISLDHGNSMKLELADITDLEKLKNIDSLLKIFITDISGLKDSLAEPLSAKRIDYLTDENGRKKIRFQQFLPKGNAFVLGREGELASLRTEQDTIHIIGIILNPSKPADKISLTHPRYYHISFYLNNINELGAYMDGRLAAKIQLIQKNLQGKWPTVLGTGSHYLKADNTIVVDQPRGFTGTGDVVTGFLSVNVQNYKSYFVPSFSVGAIFSIANREKNFKWEPGLLWEPHFFFGKNSQDKLQTFRNDFLTLVYGQGGVTDHDPRKDFTFSAVFSLGYLIHREGDFIDKNTFRLGAGKIKMSKTTIEPAMYFNNFFRGVTPAIKISQRF